MLQRHYLPFLIAALLALAMFVGFSAYDVMILNQKPHAEYPPEFDRYHLLRLGACLIAAAGLVRAFPTQSLQAIPPRPLRIGLTMALLLWLFTVVFLISPETFTALGIEDGIVEWSSAILVFLACILFISSGLRLRKFDLPRAKIAAALAFALGLLLFILGMEEVSWMQRLIGYETPLAFVANGQTEFNLHNFQTNKIENLYYVGAFVLLFLLPLLLTPIRDALPPSLQSIAPPVSVTLASAPMTALNWDMWNIIPIQMMFWVAVFCLMALTRNSRRTYGFTLLTVFACQMIYLATGDAFIRQWDVTEYKELFIAIGFFTYAIETSRLTKSSQLQVPISINIPAGGKES